MTLFVKNPGDISFLITVIFLLPFCQVSIQVATQKTVLSNSLIIVVKTWNLNLKEEPMDMVCRKAENVCDMVA